MSCHIREMIYLTIFIGGILSFFSPCVLPVVPLYLGYLTGDKENNRKDIIINTICFTLGISSVFLFLGLGFSSLGRFFYDFREIISKISGIVIIILGLFQLGILRIRFLENGRRLNYTGKTMGPLAGFLLGFTFSFAWTPCIGPALSSVLIMVGSVEDKKVGFLLMGVYTLGFIIPFLLTGMFTKYFLEIFKKNMKIVNYTSKIMGLLLIIVGIIVLSGKLNQLIGKLL